MSTRRLYALVVGLLVGLLLTPRYLLSQPQPTQLVLVGRSFAANVFPNDVIISTSSDGILWKLVRPVLVGGTAIQTVAPPNIFSDGTAYSLVWKTADLQVHHATSSDTVSWVEGSSLGTSSGAAFIQGGGFSLALLGNVVVDLSSNGSRATLPLAPASSRSIGDCLCQLGLLLIQHPGQW